LANVQGREYLATIACLVSDGHKTYALTNRHVASDAGEELFSKLSGSVEPIGQSSEKQLTRQLFSDIYPEWPGKKVYLNLDVGLIEIDDLNRWTANVQDIGTVGPLVDLSAVNLSLSLIGCRVVGMGAASGRMEGEICALFYRYKSVGGFEYLADFMIGPRKPARKPGRRRRAPAHASLLTRPGDSGTLWMLDPHDSTGNAAPSKHAVAAQYRPLAMQWGAQVFTEQAATSFALATSLSTVCNLLDVELVRDWNLDQTDTWGAIGHFSIATSVASRLTNDKLQTLMTENADIVSPSKDEILNSEFKGMGSQDFVHLADVPDMFWKPRVAKQGYTRAMEGPNHFADMDQVRAEDRQTLLKLTQDDANIDPDKWNDFYCSVNDLLSGDPIEAKHRGLLPFRVWQIFNDMVRFAKAKKVPEFVCAAGVLTHYIGDACQPLHISYLHDGDPEDPLMVPHTKKGKPVKVKEPNGGGVHSAYEDNMVNAHKDEILKALPKAGKVKASELVDTGFAAAKLTITMMRTVFQRIPPRKIVDFYINSDAKPKQLAEDMWQKFGSGTITCMQDGVHLLAVLWQSAWVAGGGDHIAATALKGITQAKAMQLCKNPKFVPSLPIHKIGDVLKKPV
ncbi:MAG: hypothetical protein ABUL64_02810, partial [Singulisphaera sp.]